MIDNIIDIHSHTLWGLDDGARSFDEALEMCFCAEDGGTSTLFVTPHLMYWDSAEQLFDRRNEKIAILEDALDHHESSLEIVPGFEVMCDDEIFSVKHFYPYTLKHSKYILIEFSFTKPTEADVSSWCDYLKSFGLVPIIAHPERYNFVKDDITSLNRLSDKGVLFQINAGSPGGVFGSAEQRISEQMLECGFVDFIGSDGHRVNIRNTDMSYYFDLFPEKIDDDYLMEITTENPKCIINDTIFCSKRAKYLKKL